MQLSSNPSLKTALSEWRKLLFAHFERLIVYFAKQHFSQEWSIFEGKPTFLKKAPKFKWLWRHQAQSGKPKPLEDHPSLGGCVWKDISNKYLKIVLKKKPASEKNVYSTYCKGKNQWKKNFWTFFQKVLFFLGNKLDKAIFGARTTKGIRQLAPQEIATSFKYRHKWKKHQTLHGFVTFKST